MTDRLREALDERPPYVLRLTGEQIGSIQPTPEGDWFTDWDEYEDFVPRRMLDAAIDEAATYRRIAGANAALNDVKLAAAGVTVAPSHPSPGESAGFDAEVARVAEMIHAGWEDDGGFCSHINGFAGRCVVIAEGLAAAGVTVAPKPDSPAADDGVACDWDENGYCRCKPAPALDVERLARALDSGIALGQPWTSETVTYRTFLIQCAATIAREYAALAMGDKP